MYKWAIKVMPSSWPHQRRIRCILSQRKVMGTQAQRRTMSMRCNASPIRCHLLAPYACPQMGSIPIASPERTEYPVMFAKPMESEPPASSSSPRLPRNNMDIIARPYSNKPMITIIPAILFICFSSSRTCSSPISESKAPSH